MFAPDVPSSEDESKNLYVKTAVLCAVIALICLAFYAYTEDWQYGGFPSATKMDRFLKAYSTLTPPQRKVDALELLLWRMRVPDNNEEGQIAMDALDKLSKYYLATHDATVLQAVVEVNFEGEFAHYICESFYMPLRDDQTFQQWLRQNPNALKSVERCEKPIYTPEEVQKLRGD